MSLEDYVEESRMRALGCLTYLAYWKEVRPQILRAIEAAAPGLLASGKKSTLAIEAAAETASKTKAKASPVA